MSGSSFGKVFKITTWGESHGVALGVVIDGCPAGLDISESYIQNYADKRRPGQSKFTTKRTESDKIRILSGVFKGKSTGAPISIMVNNNDPKEDDYKDIQYYRPGHADYVYDQKYGFRDFRGGGRSSGRETVARVIAGAVAKRMLKELEIELISYVNSIGEILSSKDNFDKSEIFNNPLHMPDRKAYEAAAKLININQGIDSLGGTVECIVKGVVPGVGEPVFEKLDAMLGAAILSIGGVKGVDFGLGIDSTKVKGSENNDNLYYDGTELKKMTNNSGGITGGISDGGDICLRAYFKPTPSIAKKQKTVDKNMNNVDISIDGRHDPTIVTRGFIVVEAMTAITVLDYILMSLLSRVDSIKSIIL